MPKLKKSREELADERFNKLVRRRIHGSQFETIAAVAERVGIGGDNLGLKLRNPTCLRAGELRELYDLGLLEAVDVVELVTRKTRAVGDSEPYGESAAVG